MSFSGSQRIDDDIVDAGRIDVIVDDDGEAILISAGKTLRSNYSRLLHVARVALLDGDDRKLSRPRFMGPDTANFRDAGSLQFFPHMCRARNRSQQRQRVRRTGRISAGNDRIVSIEDAVYPNERFQAFRTRVVAGPLAEGTFFFDFARPDFALENNFRVSGIRETGDVTANHLNGCLSEAAREIELTHSGGHGARGSKPN